VYVYIKLYVHISLHDFPIENEDVPLGCVYLRVVRFQSRNGTKILTLFWTFVMIITLIFIFAAGKLSRPDGILLALTPMFSQRHDSEIWQLRGRLLKVINCLFELAISWLCSNENVQLFHHVMLFWSSRCLVWNWSRWTWACAKAQSMTAVTADTKCCCSHYIYLYYLIFTCDI